MRRTPGFTMCRLTFLFGINRGDINGSIISNLILPKYARQPKLNNPKTTAKGRFFSTKKGGNKNGSSR